MTFNIRSSVSSIMRSFHRRSSIPLSFAVVELEKLWYPVYALSIASMKSGNAKSAQLDSSSPKDGSVTENVFPHVPDFH